MKKRTLIITAFCALALSAIAVFYVRRSGSRQTMEFYTEQPQYGYIAKVVTATGTVEPVDTVTVGAQVSGVVKFVYADFNSEVKRGQLLAKVDPSIIEAQAEQAKASLLNAESNLQYQQSVYDRQSKLYELGAISKADYQIAVNLFQSARAGVENAQAQLKMARRNLYYTQIYSPINGVILNRTISAGQTIASSFNAPTLFVIARNLTRMQVNAAVDEADIGGILPGQRVSFSVDAFPGEDFEGKVLEILLHPAVSANVVTYTTRINIDNPDLKLKPGMTARINIYTQEDSSLLIPSRALNFVPDSTQLRSFVIIRAHHEGRGKIEGSGQRGRGMQNSMDHSGRPKNLTAVYSVWVKRGDTLMEKRIVTGINDDTRVQVLHGLTTGDQVIVKMLGSAGSSNAGGSRSPFMPQMRRPQQSGGR